MGFLKRLKKPKGKIELQLDEVAYEATDKFTGRIVIDPKEVVSVDEFRLEFGGKRKIDWRFTGTRFRTSSSLKTTKIPIESSVTLQKGQHYEQPFEIDIPSYSKPDPFTELEVKVKGVAAVKGRPDLTHEVKPAINFPYVVECLRQYGGCGFITQPLPEPVKACPTCGNNLQKVWNRKYEDMMKKSAEERTRR